MTKRHTAVGGSGRVGRHLDTTRMGGERGIVVMKRYVSLEDVHHVVQALGELRDFLV